MKKSVMLFGLMVAASAWADITALTPVPREWEWWKGRCTWKNELAKAGGAQYVFIGDSIVQHFELKSGHGVWEQYFGEKGIYPSLNLGVSADCTEHVLYRLEHGQLDGYEAKYVVLMIGTNNTGHRKIDEEPPSDTILGVKRILDTIRAKQPKAKIVLCPIFPRGKNVDDPLRRRNAVVNRSIRKFANGRDILWCDCNAQFLRPDGFLPVEMMPDRLHPGKYGYEIWANAIIPYFEGRTAATLPPYVMAGELADEVALPLREDCRFHRDWWRDKLARNRKRIAEDGGTFDVVMLGDSITHYWEVGEGPDESHDIEILEKKYKIMNCGYGGDGIQHLLWRVRNGELTGYQAKVFTLMIGTNNVGGDRVEDIVAGIRNVLGEIRRLHPESKVLLTSLIPRGKDRNDKARAACEAINGVINHFCDGQTIVWHDITKLFLKPDGTTDEKLYDNEYLHPSTEGYRLWREALEPMLEKMIPVKQ